MVVAGPRVIDVCRKLAGRTFGFEAQPGTIRGDFGASTTYNLIHASDSPESAEAEIGLFFRPAEILDYAPSLRSITQGRSTFTIEFSHYEEVPKQIQEKIIAQAQKEKEES